MRSAAARAETAAWCIKHKVFFVKFECKNQGRGRFSFGCPVCVAKIREDVQRELNRHREGTGSKRTA